MGTYSDNIGNKFLGNVSMGSNYPISDTTKTNMGTDLANLVALSGLPARNLATDSQFNGLGSINILHFGAINDVISGVPIDDRVLFVSGLYNGVNNNSDNRLYLFNNSGGTLTTTPNTSVGSTNLTNQLIRRRSMDLPSSTVRNPNWIAAANEVYWCGVSDGNSLALITFSVSRSGIYEALELKFWYAGLILNPHSSLDTNSKRYVTLLSTLIYATNYTTTNDFLYYRRATTFLDNQLFSNVNASYDFTSRTGKQAVRDFEVKNGGVVMGKARNLLIGTGSYPLLVPILIIGTGGLEKWLPICHYNEESQYPPNSPQTVFMRCYST